MPVFIAVHVVPDMLVLMRRILYFKVIFIAA
jgi:hypothetical protein